MKTKLSFFFFFLSSFVYAVDFIQMTNDLELISAIQAQQKRFPNNFNFLYSTGYFVTPSARMAPEGLIGFGYANFFPYSSYNVFVQPFSFLELTANWRMFKGVEDELTKFGHGDLADRGANFKLSLLNPADDENLPFIAIGMEDFMGTRRFANSFIVLTKYLGPFAELSLGWGYGKYHLGFTKGFFGGFSLYPFISSYSLLSPLTFSVELDPKDYSNPKIEPHPLGRNSSFPLNFGLQYNYMNLLQASLALKNKEICGSAAISYNWGQSGGILPKIKDPPFYSNCYSYTEILQTFFAQGLRILSLSYKGDTLFLSIRNERWVCEHTLRERLAYLLKSFPSEDIQRFIVVIEAKNLPCQSYLFCKNWLNKYCENEMGIFEFNCLTTRKEPCKIAAKRLEWSYVPLWILSPRFETFLGGAQGKFKYDLGIKLSLEGDLPGRFFYEAAFCITTLSTVSCKSHHDYYNPSALPNVATDYIRYRTEGTFSTDILYLQWANFYKHGFFSRLALGYFQVNYAGAVGELLWYPSYSNFAVGLEGALLKKRTYHGLGVQSTLPIYNNCHDTVPYTILSQYFLDFYFDFPQVSLFAKISLGQFLARDKGLYFELSRIFPSGLRLTGWTTVTNAQDMVHGQRYFDRGIKIEIPLQLFYQCSSRRIFNYGMAAWLRDAGYRTATGKNLFEIINRERRF